MNRKFLTQFLNKISNFPLWVKEIIYNKLGEEIDEDTSLTYVFTAYKPILTYKGKCELDFKKSGFDTNIYNILESADNDFSISEIILNTYLSLEEIAGYFLFCVDEGYFELPDNSEILNIAGFLTGKLKTGEYFVENGSISKTELNDAIKQFETQKNTKKFGQVLIDFGLISKKQLDKLLSIKNEAKKRFILDHNEVPKIQPEYTNQADIYKEQISKLQNENILLKTKLEQLLTMVKKNES
ncbi:MAG: hypothetical protein ACI37Q_01415 [Candidatus Gastranaerophilaceae bacterium]